MPIIKYLFECDGSAVQAAFAALVGGSEPGWGAGARVIGDGEDLEPLWSLVDGVPRLADGLPDPLRWDASAHTATWAQALLDDAETMWRVHDSARTKALLRAYRVALADAGERFGVDRSDRGSRAAQLFFTQTADVTGRRPGEIAHRVDVADTLERRLPATWDAYLRWAATRNAVDLVVRSADRLTGESAWAAFDAASAEILASTPIAALKKKLRRLRESIQRDTADERARTTAENRCATVEHGHDGEGSCTLTGPIEDIAAIETTIRLAAVAARGCDGETRAIAQLQFDIGKDLILDGAKQAADPGRDIAVPNRKAVTPTVVVTVPALTLLGRSDEPGRLEGYGPIAPETARRIAAHAPSFHRLLTHPVTGVVLDLDRTTYAPPADLRLWVKLRDDACRFPGCQRPAYRCDIDHADEWHRGGVTNAANLVSLCRPDHNAKSLGLTEEQLRDDGIVDWTTLWGRLGDPPPDHWDPAPDDLQDDCPF